MVSIKIEDVGGVADIRWEDSQSANPLRFKGKTEMVIGTLITMLEDYRDEFLDLSRILIRIDGIDK